MRVGGAIGLDTPVSFMFETGMTAVQIMHPENLCMEQIEEFRKWAEESDTHIYVHSCLHTNPCDASRRGWYLMNMKKTMDFAEKVRAKGVVLHPGSRKETAESVAKGHLLQFLWKATTYSAVPILLETDPGSKGGTRIGSPEFLLDVCRIMDRPQVKICVDTAHLYARGWDLWDGPTRRSLLGMLHGQIALIHLNVPDAKVGLGSFLDRHNTAFVNYPRSSDRFIADFVGSYPAILERSSLENQRLDMGTIKLTMSGSGV